MKVLIDEDLDIRLRHLFSHYETYTVEYMGWKGLSNGELLDTAEAAGFVLMVTGDKGITKGQQNLDRRSIHVFLVERSRLVGDDYKAYVQGEVDRILR